MRRVLHILLVIVAVILAYLSFAPVDIEPAAWQPQPPPSSETGPYARNDLLKGIECIAVGSGKGPEAIAFDAQGRVYTGFVDGRAGQVRGRWRVTRFSPTQAAGRLASLSTPTAASSFAMQAVDF